MKLRAWSAADRLAHVLYSPSMLGGQASRVRWHHHIHLIPGWLLEAVCDRYERWIGVTDSEMGRRA